MSHTSRTIFSHSHSLRPLLQTKIVHTFYRRNERPFILNAVQKKRPTTLPNSTQTTIGFSFGVHGLLWFGSTNNGNRLSSPSTFFFFLNFNPFKISSISTRVNLMREKKKQTIKKVWSKNKKAFKQLLNWRNTNQRTSYLHQIVCTILLFIILVSYDEINETLKINLLYKRDNI